jgi:hypothetical protein
MVDDFRMTGTAGTQRPLFAVLWRQEVIMCPDMSAQAKHCAILHEGCVLIIRFDLMIDMHRVSHIVEWTKYITLKLK